VSLAIRVGTKLDINPLLEREHYLGPLKSGWLILVGETSGRVTCGQVWRKPTSRNLPADGSWLELSRWVLTPAAGLNAGSRFHAAAVRFLREKLPGVTTLVSYSDPSVGHTGSLYAACNWVWCPTWHRLRPPPTGGGQWSDGVTQAPKDRWVFAVQADKQREDLLSVSDSGALRSWRSRATDKELRRAAGSFAADLRAAASEAAS
jgi:hypothetical protein